MEALAIVSLSGNILQFVDASCKIIDNVKKIRHGGPPDGLESTTLTLKNISTKLIQDRQNVQGQSLATQPTKDPIV